jgi:hypothetical protein
MAKSGVLIRLVKRLHRLDVERRAIVAGIKAASEALMDLPAARARRRVKRAPRAARKTGPPKRRPGVKKSKTRKATTRR